MKLYFYVNVYWTENPEIYETENPKIYETIRKYSEIHQFPTSAQWYWCDIKFVRKLKLSKLEKSHNYSDIIDLLFNNDLITFHKDEPIFSTSGTSDTSGSSGSSGVYVNEKDKCIDIEFLDELIKQKTKRPTNPAIFYKLHNKAHCRLYL